MHIIREHEDTLVIAETQADGSIKVKYYELREYVELSAEKWDSLSAACMRAIPVVGRALHTCDRCAQQDLTFALAAIEHACGHWLCAPCEAIRPQECIACWNQGVVQAAQEILFGQENADATKP